MKKITILLALILICDAVFLLCGCHNEKSRTAPKEEDMYVTVNNQIVETFYWEYNGTEYALADETVYQTCYSKAYETEETAFDISIRFYDVLIQTPQLSRVEIIKVDGENTIYYMSNVNLTDRVSNFNFNSGMLELSFDLNEKIPNDFLLLFYFDIYWSEEYNGCLHLAIKTEL